MAYGSTQVYLMESDGPLREVEALCRVLEIRGYTLLSATQDGAKFLLTLRASSQLYVSYKWGDIEYQTGPYDGHEAADEAAEEMKAGGATEAFVTAHRDHTRTFIGADDA